jgi:signal peptidase I
MTSKRPLREKSRTGPASTMPADRDETAAARSRTAARAQSAAATQRTIRETVESIVVAFVLAFLFRTFEAEAFVIPTGSMAPTLQGRHRDLICPECKYRFRVNASSEVDDYVQDLQSQLRQPGLSPEKRYSLIQSIENKEVVGGTCPNCRYTMDFESEAKAGRQWPAYNGDRILVAKFPFDFADPKRWDVVVFRFPGNAQMNYIKRLVGRPNETIRIFHGDIFTRPTQGSSTAPATSSSESALYDEPAEGFEIARKPPTKVRSMSQAVYDNDYVVKSMTEAGWPLRWQPWPAGDAAANPWKIEDDGRSFSVAGGKETAWIRYQHFIPFAADWDDMLTAGKVTGNPQPMLITDFYAYNSNRQRFEHHAEPAIGQHWVADLLLETAVDVQSRAGTLLLDLVRAGRHMQCEIDVQSGAAQLKIDGLADFKPTAKTALRGPGRHRLVFANVDQQLLLWVDGSLAEFDSATAYAAVGDEMPSEDDLAPAGIGTRGAEAKIEHIVLRRDVYYIADNDSRGYGGISDYSRPLPDLADLAHLFQEPRLWDDDSLFAKRRAVTFPLHADQFFVLGDNSPASKDSRLWAEGKPEFFVSRELLIGKALYIYWPHSWDRPIWFFPNFKDMGFVR